jgi:P4 family phage/plasmid primase-like protien
MVKNCRVCELCYAVIPEEWDNQYHYGTCPSCKRGSNFIIDIRNRKDIEVKLAGEENEKIRKQSLMSMYNVLDINHKTGYCKVNCIQLAKLIHERCGFNFKTILDEYSSRGYIYYYRDGMYIPGGEEHIKRLVDDFLDEHSSIHRKNEVVDYIRHRNAVNRERLEPPVHLINVKNGIFDMKKNELIPHSPDYFFLNQIPVEYKPDAKCPHIENFVREITYEKFVQVVQEMIGYVMYRRYKFHKAFLLYGGGRNGKCQSIGSLVLMGDGSWKKVEDIVVGDVVVSPQQDGSSTFETITHVHSRFEPDMYGVYEQTRDKKLLYKCAGNHDIPIWYTSSRRTFPDDSTPREYKRVLVHSEAQDLYGIYNEKSEFCSFTTCPVTFDNTDAEIDAYTLGAIIGDGSFIKHTLNITSADYEIVEHITNIYPGEMTRIQDRVNNKSLMYYFSTKGYLAEQLINLGLYDKRSGTKFIPKPCLISSIEYRYNLLAGLIDTDGYISKTGQITYCTKSRQLADDIRNLVFSLGGYARVREIQKTCKSHDFVGDYFDVSIQFQYPDRIPLRTWKKDRLQKERRDNPCMVGIKIKKEKPDMVYGFSITGNSKWYVTDNWMVTHNSTLINVMETFLGSKNFSNQTLNSLLENRFATSSLYGKLANFGSEISGKTLNDTSQFKHLTGDDTIMAEEKGKSAFHFRNYAKLIFNANHIPYSRYDKTLAYFQRWIIIVFPETFDVDDPKTDPNILDKITSMDELEGLLIWGILGLQRLLKQGKFSYEDNDEETVGEKYELLSKPDKRFINENIMNETGNSIPIEQVYSEYVKWAEKRSYPIVVKKVFSRSMKTYMSSKENNITCDVEVVRINGKPTRCYINVAWKEEPDNLVKLDAFNDDIKTGVKLNIKDKKVNDEPIPLHDKITKALDLIDENRRNGYCIDETFIENNFSGSFFHHLVEGGLVHRLPDGTYISKRGV